jgi:anti-sigma-K factor RskA
MSHPSDQSNPEYHPDHWPELLAGYVLGDLTAAESSQVQQYLDRHPEAIAQVEDLKNTLAVLPIGLPEVTLPPDLKARVMAAAQNSEQNDAVLNAADRRHQPELGANADRPARRQFRRKALGWPLLAAAATIAALGLQSYFLQQEMAATRQEIAQLHSTLKQTQDILNIQKGVQTPQQQALNVIAQAPGRMLHLVGSGIAASATGTVVISPSQNRAVLMLKDLPPPPAGKVYHLWAMVEGRKVACIQFTPEADRQVLMQLPAERWRSAAGVAITIEPQESTDQPTGEMVMSGAEI